MPSLRGPVSSRRTQTKRPPANPVRFSGTARVVIVRRGSLSEALSYFRIVRQAGSKKPPPVSRRRVASPSISKVKLPFVTTPQVETGCRCSPVGCPGRSGCARLSRGERADWRQAAFLRAPARVGAWESVCRSWESPDRYRKRKSSPRTARRCRGAIRGSPRFGAALVQLCNGALSHFNGRHGGGFHRHSTKSIVAGYGPRQPVGGMA